MFFQRNADRSKIEVSEVASSPSSSEDNQSNPKAQSRLRLRRHLAQERLQHPHRLHPLSGLYFTNILQAAFSYESVFAAFLYLQFGFVIFWQKNIGAKAACKMLMKLAPWVDFTNILTLSF